VSSSALDLAALAAPLLAGLRLLPVTALSPLLGGPLVPPAVRVGLALTLGWATHAGAGAPPSTEPLSLLAAGARELAMGGLLALVAVLPVEAARAAGRLADTLRGATLSELHVAPIRQRESAVGDLLAQWCLVIAAWTGGDRLLLSGLLGTFALVPPGGSLPAPLLGAAGIRLVTELTAAAVAMAAPAAAGVLAADLTVATVERIAPGLGVAGAAQPARAALGIAFVALAASAVGGRLASVVAFAGRAPSQLLPGAVP
jgi:type III secretory pathway component EscT